MKNLVNSQRTGEMRKGGFVDGRIEEKILFASPACPKKQRIIAYMFYFSICIPLWFATGFMIFSNLTATTAAARELLCYFVLLSILLTPCWSLLAVDFFLVRHFYVSSQGVSFPRVHTNVFTKCGDIEYDQLIIPWESIVSFEKVEYWRTIYIKIACEENFSTRHFLGPYVRYILFNDEKGKQASEAMISILNEYILKERPTVGSTK